MTTNNYSNFITPDREQVVSPELVSLWQGLGYEFTYSRKWVSRRKLENNAETPENNGGAPDNKDEIWDVTGDITQKDIDDRVLRENGSLVTSSAFSSEYNEKNPRFETTKPIDERSLFVIPRTKNKKAENWLQYQFNKDRAVAHGFDEVPDPAAKLQTARDFVAFAQKTWPGSAIKFSPDSSPEFREAVWYAAQEATPKLLIAPGEEPAEDKKAGIKDKWDKVAKAEADRKAKEAEAARKAEEARKAAEAEKKAAQDNFNKTGYGWNPSATKKETTEFWTQRGSRETQQEKDARECREQEAAEEARKVEEAKKVAEAKKKEEARRAQMELDSAAVRKGNSYGSKPGSNPGAKPGMRASERPYGSGRKPTVDYSKIDPKKAIPPKSQKVPLVDITATYPGKPIALEPKNTTYVIGTVPDHSYKDVLGTGTTGNKNKNESEVKKRPQGPPI